MGKNIDLSISSSTKIQDLKNSNFYQTDMCIMNINEHSLT